MTSQSDIFALDLATGTIKIVSLAADGSGGNDASLHPAVSADGTTIAFESRASNLVENDTNETVDIFVRAGDGVVERVSTTPEGIQSEGACRRPRISADGRYVVFLSRGQNLVVPDSNGQYDVFIRDRVDNTLARVPIVGLPEEGNDNILRVAISDDTMIIAYASPSPDIAPNDENDVADIFVQRR